MNTVAKKRPTNKHAPARRAFSFALFLLVLLTACGGMDATASTPPAEPAAWTACTTVTDTAPSVDCEAGQLSVTRCTGAGELNPIALACRIDALERFVSEFMNVNWIETVPNEGAQ